MDRSVKLQNACGETYRALHGEEFYGDEEEADRLVEDPVRTLESSDATSEFI